MKKKISLILLITINTLKLLYPIGAGMFLYRLDNHKEPELLFVLDTNQTDDTRIGFEQTGGSIGDQIIDGKIDPTNPETFLSGAIREMLEELLFFPAIELQQTYPFTIEKYPTIKTKNSLSINHKYRNDAINTIKDFILNQQGSFYLYKSKRPYTLFFWNVSNICNQNVPYDIVQYRMRLKTKFPKVRFHHHLHAEPIAFAWVPAKNLLRTCNNPNHEWVKISHYAEYDTKQNTFIPIKKSKQVCVNAKQGKIRLSKFCMSLMQQHSPSILYKKKKGSFKAYSKNYKELPLLQQPKPNETSSDMKTILQALRQA